MSSSIIERTSNRLTDLEVGREIFDVLGRYGMLSPLQRIASNSHVLLGMAKKRFDIAIRIVANSMIYNLGESMGRHLLCVSQKELLLKHKDLQHC